MDQSSKSVTERTAMHAAAKASYDRCCAAPDFFPSFYRNFFSARPDVKPLFAKTDFQRQHNLLRHALSLLLIYPNKPEAEARSLLRRVAERHSRSDLGIDPSLYEPFIEALMLTVKEHDPEFTSDIEMAWRTTVEPGVEYMKAKY